MSEAGEELSAQPAIKGIVQAITENREQFPAVELMDGSTENKHRSVQEFFQSDLFKSLPQEERIESFKGTRDDGYWFIEGPQSDETLWEMPSEYARIPVVSDDKLLLSGITMEDMDSAGALGDIERYQDFSFPTKLNFANFIGAAILAKKDEGETGGRDQANSFEYDISDNCKRRVVVGGDIHGDFRIYEYEIYTEGSIDPTGRRQLYAPYPKAKAVSGYHSVEMGILVSALRHLDLLARNDLISSGEQREMLENVVTRYEEAQNQTGTTPFAGHFADYGDDSPQLDWHLNSYESYFEDPNAGRSEEIWEKSPVNPNRSWFLETRTRGEMFTMANTSEDFLEDISEISIGLGQVPDLIIALLNQSSMGAGRTSDKSLIKLLHSRLKMLQ